MLMDYQTRVYQYGAVPLVPFPEEGIEALWQANKLWNQLVEIHNENSVEYEQARRDADEEYKLIAEELDLLEKKISKAFDDKRTARMKAGTRSSSHPLIKAENEKIAALKGERGELWEKIKVPRNRAKLLIDQKAISDAFIAKKKLIASVKNFPALTGQIIDEVTRNFQQARSKVFQTPRSRLRFHRFDGTGYFHFRLRDNVARAKVDGVDWAFLQSSGSDDDRAFTLEANGVRGKKPRFKLRVKLAGGQKKETKIFALFDLILHRPIPEGSQINNAKLMCKRVGDHFKYTVNFSVRVPVAAPAKLAPSPDAIGIDIGFRRLADKNLRAGTFASLNGTVPVEHISLTRDFVGRVNYYEDLQGELADTAAALGKEIKPHLKSGSVLDPDHPRFNLLQSVVKEPANVTTSHEKAYKLASWFKSEPDTLPLSIQKPLMDWWDSNWKKYREMHHVRKKVLGYRKETYRILAHRLVSYRLPIGYEEINLTKAFAEVKDKDNELSDAARAQRFMVSNSEFLLALKNVADREGVLLIKVPAKNTSKRCSGCGTLNKALRAEMEWTCPSCGVAHDRDENAAKNIAREALEKFIKKAA